MNILIGIGIYLAAVVVSFFCLRLIFVVSDALWTKGERRIAIFYSIFMPPMVLIVSAIAAILYIIYKTIVFLSCLSPLKAMYKYFSDNTEVKI